MVAEPLRDLELVLLAAGGVELVDLIAEETVWASDSDDEFREQFRELLSESDVGPILDYLVSHGIVSNDEADSAEVSEEDAQTVAVEGEALDDDDDGDWDDDEDWDDE